MSLIKSAATPALVVRCADEVWLATALLHREQSKRTEFTIREIVERVKREGMHGVLRKAISVHASVHCVANRPPGPAGFRMLYATGKRTRRLYRPSDDAHPKRRGKIVPKGEEIPERYHYLLDWYQQQYKGQEPVTSFWLGGVRARFGYLLGQPTYSSISSRIPDPAPSASAVCWTT